MPLPIGFELEEEQTIAETPEGFELEPVSKVPEGFKLETERRPMITPTLPNYLKFKLNADRANSERSKYGREAMWGRMDTQEAIRKGNEERDYWMTQAGPYEDLSFGKHPFKYIAGESVQLLPYMLSSQVEGLKYGLTLGGGFAAITAVAGQAGPQLMLPEEVITVPAAFAGGMATGYSYGVIKNILDREGGGLYLDMAEKGISPETAQPIALAGGTMIGILELSQFNVLSKPFKQAFSKVIRTKAGKVAIMQAIGKYTKSVGINVLQEDLQEMTSLISETIGGVIDEKPDAIPTKEEWINRLLETTARSTAGMAVISVPGVAIDITTSLRTEKIMKKQKDVILLNKIITEQKNKFQLTDTESKLHDSAISKQAMKQPLTVEEQVVIEKVSKIRAEIKPTEIIKEKIQITPEKIKPDISGVAPLQRQIQAMEERQVRVEAAQYALEDIDTIRESLRGRIKKHKGEYLKEELREIPKIYITKEGGIAPDEAIDELRNNFNIDVKDAYGLREYLKDLEKTRKDLITEIKANRPELITKRETTLLKERIKATEQGLREGRIQTKEEIEKTQTELIQMIEDAKLSLDERAKFLRTIKNIQTREDLAREFPKVAERLQIAKEKETRSELVGEIKKVAERAKTSKVIAVEYAELIKDVVNQFELQGHRPETIEALQKTKEYILRQIEAGREVEMPKEVLDKLEILQRKPFKEITTQELEDLRDSIDELERLGKTKLRLRQMAYERRKAEDLAKLKAGSKPIQSQEKIKKGIGEKLTTFEKLKNILTAKFNTLTKKKISLTPMDAVIDELDGEKNYKGANFTIFKKTLDKNYSDYLDAFKNFIEKVTKLAEELDEGNFERIAAYATLQREGGIEKLESLGYTQEEVEKITLTAKEMALLEAMQVEFDKSWPQISETMRLVYNEPLGKEKHYFPFITDFDAMTDFEIRDRFLNTPEYSKILKKNPEMGFTKQRVGGEQKIKLNAMEVFLRHMNDVAYLITVGKDIKYLNDIATTEDYRQSVGDIGQEIMREWLDLIARKGRLAGDRVAILDSIRKYTAGVYLSFKLSSALVQFTSLFDGAALIGNYAFEGTQMITNKEIRQFLKDNFPEWRERVADDPAFIDFYKDNSFVDKAIQLGISPLKLFDKLTAAAITIGAYKKYCVENDIDFDISKPNKEAIAYAQLIMRRTQSTSSFKDVPLAMSKGMLTGNISVDKLILQFQSFLLNRWSLISHDLYKAGIKGENKKQAINIAMWLIVATVAESGIRRITREAIKSIKDEDDDEKKGIVEEIIVNALQNIPFMSNVIGLLYYGSLGIPSIDWIKRAAEYSSAGFKSKTEGTKLRNFIKAAVLLLPGGSQITQMLPKKDEDEDLSPI